MGLMSQKQKENFNHLKQWLVPLLNEKKMSVEDLAQKANITRTIIYWWLSDKYRPDEQSMVRVCAVLGRPLEEGLRQYTPRKRGRPVGYSPGPRRLTARG
jgi:transcriptional regulator with XRE-family HTH domain